MICIDNSEWMRNGDYSPSRLQAQTEAVNLLCGAKTQVKSWTLDSIRVFDCAVGCDFRDFFRFVNCSRIRRTRWGSWQWLGKELEFWQLLPLILAKSWPVCTVSRLKAFGSFFDISFAKLNHLFSGLEVGGEINLTAAIQIAQLALKHRQNKNQRQRIIVFAGRYSLSCVHA